MNSNLGLVTQNGILSALGDNSLTIVDAKDSGLECEEIRNAIETIASTELYGEQGTFRARDYVREEYFGIKSDYSGGLIPETILIAKVANKIVGFLIAKKGDVVGFDITPPDVSLVTYLAVDSMIKRSGVGTKLMVTAMSKAKKMGKRFLSLEYIADGLGVDLEKARTKKEFYESFTSKFKIPMEIKKGFWCHQQLHLFPYYDLHEVDIDAISLNLSSTSK